MAEEGVPPVLSAPIWKLGGRGQDKSKWQCRDCTLNSDGLRWPSGSIAPKDIASIHGVYKNDAEECKGKPAELVFVVQLTPDAASKGGKHYFFAAETPEQRQEWWSELARLAEASATQGPRRKAISFPGGVVSGERGDHGTICTMSFCGDNKREWDRLVASASDGGLSTACVFLTTEAEGLGQHATNPETGKCWCHDLYGKPQEFGCQWFEAWRTLVHQAHEKGQMPVVFYKAGHLERVGAAHTSFPAVKTIEGEIEWEDLKHYSFQQLKWMPGLGASQKGEVAYLKKQGIGFMRVDVTEGAPTAEQTERMLVEHAEALDLGTAEGRKELTDVAIKLRAIGALQASLKFRRMDVTCCTEQLGPRHKRTLQAKMNLAVLLKNLGERDEARALYTEVIAGYTEQLGSTHTDTLDAKMNLATLLDDLGERDEARALYTEVIAGYTEQLGGTHTDTLNAKYNLAVLEKAEGDVAEARRLYNECAAGYAQAYGEEHSETQDARRRAAAC
jgi:tetratricopeptide (TPR) repeat protein